MPFRSINNHTKVQYTAPALALSSAKTPRLAAILAFPIHHPTSLPSTLLTIHPSYRLDGWMVRQAGRVDGKDGGTHPAAYPYFYTPPPPSLHPTFLPPSLPPSLPSYLTDLTSLTSPTFHPSFPSFPIGRKGRMEGRSGRWKEGWIKVR